MNSGNSVRWQKPSKSKSSFAIYSKANSTAYSRKRKIPPTSSPWRATALLGPSQDETAMALPSPTSPRAKSREITLTHSETPWMWHGTPTRRTTWTSKCRRRRLRKRSWYIWAQGRAVLTCRGSKHRLSWSRPRRSLNRCWCSCLRRIMARGKMLELSIICCLSFQSIWRK